MKAKSFDWRARHTPVSGTMNAGLTALSVASVGGQTGLSPVWTLGASVVGAAGSAVAGASAEKPLAKPSILLRAGSWLAGGTWVSWALNQHDVWDWGVVGPLVGLAIGAGSMASALASKERKEIARQAEAVTALSRVKLAAEWEMRIERVCGLKGSRVLNIEKWTDAHGNETGAGFDMEIQLPEGGANWRTLASAAEQLASDADLPEGCGVEVQMGISRARAILKISLVNALLTDIPIPHDASELSFEDDFDIGVLRDSGLATINIREFSAMLAGAKRTGKTNQLLAIITRLLRMPNLRVWVIDFNGGGVALQWLRAWDDLGRPGRPPIDWVAADPREAEQMAQAAVRIAKARKIEYTRLMAEHDTDLLPMTPEIPGIVIITDEGAEVYANPKHQHVSAPMKEVLRIAGSSGVNQINCFLRATADTTGDSLIKSQSRALIGMRMSDEAEISYLLGWKCGVKPEDMPEQGYGACTMDPSGPASIFRGYRVKPSDINWFVENTATYRENEALDEVSKRAAGEAYATRWAEDRVAYIFSGAPAPKVETALAGGVEAVESAPELPWDDTPLSPEPDRLRKRIEAEQAEQAERVVDPFDQVLAEAGVDPDAPDLGSAPEFVRPEPFEEGEPDEEATAENMRDVVFGLVKQMTPRGGIAPQEIIDAIKRIYGDEAAPRRETITRWLREDERVYKPTGFKKYAVRDEYMED